MVVQILNDRIASKYPIPIANMTGIHMKMVNLTMMKMKLMWETPSRCQKNAIPIGVQLVRHTSVKRRTSVNLFVKPFLYIVGIRIPVPIAMK